MNEIIEVKNTYNKYKEELNEIYRTDLLSIYKK